jgi:peptide/nickel transport system substrate-binding protein
MLMVALLTSSMLLVLALTPGSVSAQQAPKGPWVDEVVFSVELDEAKVIDMLLKNEIQVYFRDLKDVENFKKVKASPDLVVCYIVWIILRINI